MSYLIWTRLPTLNQDLPPHDKWDHNRYQITDMTLDLPRCWWRNDAPSTFWRHIRNFHTSFLQRDIWEDISIDRGGVGRSWRYWRSDDSILASMAGFCNICPRDAPDVFHDCRDSFLRECWNCRRFHFYRLRHQGAEVPLRVLPNIIIILLFDDILKRLPGAW